MGRDRPAEGAQSRTQLEQLKEIHLGMVGFVSTSFTQDFLNYTQFKTMNKPSR